MDRMHAMIPKGTLLLLLLLLVGAGVGVGVGVMVRETKRAWGLESTPRMALGVAVWIRRSSWNLVARRRIVAVRRRVLWRKAMPWQGEWGVGWWWLLVADGVQAT